MARQLSFNLASSRFPKKKSEDQVKTEKILMEEQTEIARRYGRVLSRPCLQSTEPDKPLNSNAYAESKGK